MPKLLFQAIQLNIRSQFSSIWPIDMTLSCATTPNQNGPGSDGNEGVLCIPQSSIITWTSPSDCLVSYPGHSAEKSVYSTAPADWAMTFLTNGIQTLKKCGQKEDYVEK